MTALWFPMVHILQEALEQLTESLRKAVVVFWGPVSVEEWFVWGKGLYSNLGCLDLTVYSRWTLSYCNLAALAYWLLKFQAWATLSGSSLFSNLGLSLSFYIKKILVMICYQITFIFPSNLQPKTFRRVFNTWAEGQPPPTQEILWYC